MDRSGSADGSDEVNNNSIGNSKSSALENSTTLSNTSSSKSSSKSAPNSVSSFNLSPNPVNSKVVSSTFPSIQDFDEVTQEKFVVQELLYVLSGVNSSLFTCYNVSPQKIEFTADPRVPLPLSSLAMDVTKLAGYYYTVNRYLEEVFGDAADGRVIEALASFIEDYMQEYFILLAQLDTEFQKNGLSLHTLNFYIQSAMQKMSALSSVVIVIEMKKLRGGALLSLLHEKTLTSGGVDTDEFCLKMATKACVPYFQMLENWIYKGVIKDRFSEFLVMDTSPECEALTDDDFWEKRYKPVSSQCPSFLLSNLDRIVKTGKYLNVVRHCGKGVQDFKGEKITFSVHQRDYDDKIEKAYSYASKKLLSLLMKEYDLMNLLASMKHYFLMDKGDFIAQFMKVAEPELSKPVGDVNPDRLESLMGLALRTASTCTDNFKNCLKVQLSPYTIVDELLSLVSIESDSELQRLEANFQIPGIQGFSFSYEVKWPISLILTRRTITVYQLLFRHMIFCKHVEKQLNYVWIKYKGSYRKGSAGDEQGHQPAIFALRQKMLEFVQNLLYYMTFEVIEPAWETLLESIKKVSNVDEVIQRHDEFVMGLLYDSMIASKDLLEPVTIILKVCLRFCTKITSLFSTEDGKKERIGEKLAGVDKKFTALIVEFLKKAADATSSPYDRKASKIGCIITRLNFNGYYSESLEGGEKQNSET